MRLALALICLASPAFALDLTLPNATPTKVETRPAASVRLPDAPWSADVAAPVSDGAIRRTVLEIPNNTLTTLQLLAPLRETLEQEGYREVFTCADAICGSFDFRFQLDLIGEPHMHVDLGNYRYVLATKPGAVPHTVSLVASPSSTGGFVHITEVSEATFPAPEPPDVTEPEPEPDPITSQDLPDVLTSTGRVVLDDLDFGTGSADLGSGPFPSLTRLTEWLENNPSARVVLVGHTDAVGSLDANTSLSRRRAAAVEDRLITSFGVDPTQLQSAGAGYLAPQATNLTAEGRAANRRVEVVILSLE